MFNPAEYDTRPDPHMPVLDVHEAGFLHWDHTAPELKVRAAGCACTARGSPQHCGRPAGGEEREAGFLRWGHTAPDL